MGSLYFVILSIVVMTLMLTAGSSRHPTRPNIVILMADDLGWNDVSLHGSDQILTPNIDVLGYSGVIFNRYYTHCVCTPSRAAFLTGKYAYVTGMQGWPIANTEDRGLPITEKILPQYLKELGYATHLVGKWHVGSSRSEYLPTKRGFDTHFGHRAGFIDYYEYTAEEPLCNDTVNGMGLYQNERVAWEVEGYLTDVYNEKAVSLIKSHDASSPLFLMVGYSAPHSANAGALLQAPYKEVRAMRHIESAERRILAAMVKKLDDSVGDVIEALKKKGILNNTIIVFVSDNGAVASGFTSNYGSNWPLRGLKMSPFEGGVRVPGVMWIPQHLPNHLFQGYMHVADWLPTLLKAAGSVPPTNIDGLSLWDDVTSNKTSSRQEMFDIDDYFGFSSIILGDYKLITGNMTTLQYSNYQGGGNLLGVIGQTPSYENALVKSKAFKSFKSIGRSVTDDYTKLRKSVKVECEHPSSDDKICYPQNGKMCLYNIKEDPCEKDDLSDSYPNIVDKMLTRLLEETKRLNARTYPIFNDPRSKPALFNYTWAPFADYI